MPDVVLLPGEFLQLSAIKWSDAKTGKEPRGLFSTHEKASMCLMRFFLI